MSKEKKKKPIFKKWWFWLIVVLIIGAIGNDGSDTEATPTTTPTTQAITEVATEPTETATTSIELIAGEPGEYGELFTLNKDTEFEETYYVYRIPAGTYSVTNAGEYPDQINICSEEVHTTDDGWEEPAEVFYVKLLDVGASDTFSIEDGQYIEIHEPAKFILELVG